jgi:hypothetical protein
LRATLLLHDNVKVPEPPVIVVAESVQDRLVEFVVTARVTVPAKPFSGDTVMIAVPAEPVVTLTLGALDVIVKS